uniref:Uncharacterized protein n=1 Tax=Picea sitchensis TaxID=3332 RepID=A0A6B9XY19_PICSI|nr:hypothetical protein Q903MT_gene5522 [Picea sitchensis]
MRSYWRGYALRNSPRPTNSTLTIPSFLSGWLYCSGNIDFGLPKCLYGMAFLMAFLLN